jgi:glycosyltransferase involved in cell wall biosynthesis
MKILYLAAERGITINQNGGAGTHIRGTIKAFSANGHGVLPIIGGDEIALPGRVPLPGAGSGDNVRARIKTFLPEKMRLLLRDGRYFLWDKQLEKCCASKVAAFRPDVIYERSAYLSYLGSRLAKRFKIPHFLETSGCMTEIFAKSFGVFSVTMANALERAKLGRATRVVVEAKSAVGHVSKKFQLEPERIIPKPLGVDREQFKPDDDMTERICDEHRLHGKVVAGFLGTFAPYQGVRYLIEAARLLEKTNPSVVFLMVGWGNEAPAMKALVEGYRLHNVIFAGKVDRENVASYLAAFDIGVVPDCEAHMYPIKAVEYGLLGICPLVPDYPAFEGLVMDGHNGRLFDHRSAEDLARSLATLVTDRRRIQELGESWKQFVFENLTWEKCVQPVLEAMSEEVGKAA